MIRYRFYRLFMRLAHRHGWHHMHECHPDGDTMLVCSWCGIRIVTVRLPLSTDGLLGSSNVQSVGFERSENTHQTVVGLISSPFRVFAVIRFTEFTGDQFLSPNLVPSSLRILLEVVVSIQEVAVNSGLRFLD